MAAKLKQLDKIAVTDHNTIAGARLLYDLDPEFIIIGEEITWAAPGEVIGLFLNEAVPEHRSADYTLDALRDQDAFIFIPHPFAPFHFFCPPWTIQGLAGRIDAIEVRNGRNFHLFNALASAFSTVTGIRGISGSDAHRAADAGRAGMLLPDFSDAVSLRHALRSAECFGSGLPLADSVKLLKKFF